MRTSHIQNWGHANSLLVCCLRFQVVYVDDSEGSSRDLIRALVKLRHLLSVGGKLLTHASPAFPHVVRQFT